METPTEPRIIRFNDDKSEDRAIGESFEQGSSDADIERIARFVAHCMDEDEHLLTGIWISESCVRIEEMRGIVTICRDLVDPTPAEFMLAFYERLQQYCTPYSQKKERRSDINC